MISWFNRSRIRSYVKLSTRKQNKMKQEVDQRHSEQRSILDSRLANARDCARKADRLQKRGKDEKAKEEINSFKLELASSQPVLNAYVNTALEKQLLEVMAVEGFTFPDVLNDLRSDIDYGLFSVNATDELDVLLSAEVNPFDELGIEI
ncbi:MAG: hypothetical protein ACJZ67_02640 [Candidatus Thalassarchaeaceae archaeon]|nr:MAG: hypothetical protein DWB89_06345 [Candidatus Poseidoniales archaeon]|tara:strand:- start:216 stop:662 length:447 start_codon:yes stop_codon:yes gene_type:complete